MAALIASSFRVRSVSLIPVRSSSGGDQGRVDGIERSHTSRRVDDYGPSA